MSKMFCYAGDVSGYKNILLSLPLGQQKARTDEFKGLCSEAAEKYGFQDSYMTVSDTIFVTAENNKEALKKLLEFSGYMLTNGIKKSLPIRSAIDFGDAQLDTESKIAYGKAAAGAYNLAEEQDWVGACCAEDCVEDDPGVKVPKLPHISELWNFDLVFVYPVPMKNGKILTRPVVSWEIPSYEDFRDKTVGRGLVVDKNMDWKYANRVQNTIIFSDYLNAAKSGLIEEAKPEAFRGDLPIRYINGIIKESVEEIKDLRRGWSIIKIPGRRDKIILPTSDGAKLVPALKNILENPSNNSKS